MEISVQTIDDACNASGLSRGNYYFNAGFCGRESAYRNGATKCCISSANAFEVLAIPIGAAIPERLIACIGLTEELLLAVIPDEE